MRIFFFSLLPLLVVIGAADFAPGVLSKREKNARLYCGSCHIYPSPDLFPADHWEKEVLPRMALFMGRYPNDSMRHVLQEQSDFFPDTALVSEEVWAGIVQFYLKKAPKSISAPALPPVSNQLPCFSVQMPSGKVVPPGTCMTQFGENGNVYIGDAYAKKLFIFDSTLQLLQQGQMGEGLVDMQKTGGGMWLTVMGSFVPTDVANGFVLNVDLSTGMGYRAIDALRRPVSTAFGDITGDSLPEIAVSEFGQYKGALAWYEEKNDAWKKHTLVERPGAVRCVIKDVDADGDNDITALFAQGDEGIWQFINDGKAHFTARKLLGFNPANGSSYFDFCDFNADGKLDILYCCGDDADFKRTPKPWHGIYVFLNDGQGQYRQNLFLPLPGAYKAFARDYDGDGDLDVAAIAFFPDFERNPEQGFVFFQRDGASTFSRHSFPESTRGRWMCMAEGDPDRDGDIDLVLGSMTFDTPQNPALVEQWKVGGLPFVVLRNETKPLK
jgi:hypothetical protein